MVLKQCGQRRHDLLRARPRSASRCSAGRAWRTRTRSRSAGPGPRCRSRPGRAPRTSPRLCAAGSRWPWWSSWPGPPARPAQPTQNRYSIVRRRSSRPRRGPRSRARPIQSPRRVSPMPQGSPLFSRFRSIPAASTGNADSISTWCRRIPSMWSMCSMSTGHSSTHAPQFVHDQSTSGSMTPSSSLVPTSGRSASALTASGSFSRSSSRGGQQVRGLGEGVVAQVQDDLLGGQRLAGGPGRALRLAPPALGAGAPCPAGPSR